jgi:hypothetical protein
MSSQVPQILLLMQVCSTLQKIDWAKAGLEILVGLVGIALVHPQCLGEKQTDTVRRITSELAIAGQFTT